MSMNDILYPSSYVRADMNNIPTWYEFLLKDGLLIEHLSENDPEPSACMLIKQFFDQANKPVNEQGQILPPPDNQRNKSLKTLALQTAALLKWNLSTLETELPIANRHQLFSELMKTCKVSIPLAPQNELGSAIEKLHDHSIMALVLYCCWGARTVVKSTFPSKPGGRITPTVPQSVPYQANAQQRSDEIRDQILTILKDQLVDIVQYLEAVLHHVKRPIYLPSYDTFTSPGAIKLNGDPGGIRVSFEELHAQLCYDLGCMHFTHSFYEKAGEMFGHVIEWFRRLPTEKSGFCSIDEDRLRGYRTACIMVSNNTDDKDDLMVEIDSLYLKIRHCMKVKGSALRELGEYIIEDVYKKEVSTAYLDQIERELESDRSDEYGSDTVFDVKWSNAVRRAVRNIDQPTGLWTFDMNVAQLQRVVGFVQLVSAYLNFEESKYLGAFLYSLANNLSDETLREQLLNFEIVRRFIDDDDLNELILRLKAPCLRPLVLETESPASPEDMSNSSSRTSLEQLIELERALIVSLDPVTIKETLTKLHSMKSSRKFSNLCSQWELDNFYVSIISSSTVDAMGFDLLSIIFAKARLCCCNGDYKVAKSLVSFINNTCTAPEEVKVKRLASNELLKVELLTLLSDESLTYADKEECGDLRAQLSDVVTRCRSTLASYGDQSKLAALPSRLTDLCAAMLLNLEDLTYFISVTRGASSPPALRFACLLASVRAGLIGRPSEARKPASELWSAAITIFQSMAASNLTGSGRSGQKKVQLEPVRNLLPPNAIISRPALVEFVKLIKNPSILQIVVSLLVHLHRLSRTDVLSDVTCPDAGLISELWPTGLDGTAISGPCVTVALREVLAYCLTHQPRRGSWIRTMADLHYAFNNYGAALQAYLLLGAVSTNYFNNISSTGPYEDEQVIQRMIKCCMQLRCYTQAAVLCQLTKEIDYPTAFKALQENRERSDAGELHYFNHIWDVQILEHAAYEHRESNEVMKMNAAVKAISRPELNHSNAPQVSARVKAFRKAKFFQAMARQYLS